MGRHSARKPLWSLITSGLAAVALTFLPAVLGLFATQPAHAVATFSLMNGYTPGAQPNVAALELGVELTTSADTYVTQVKYYKPSASTGQHIANVWNASGGLLASATFTNDSGSDVGWKTVDLATPVHMLAGNTFTISVWSNDFYFTGELFPSLTSGPLTVVHGVYNYTSSPAFPSSSFYAVSPVGSNYAVDLTVQASVPASTTITTTPTTSSITYGSALSASTLSGGVGSVPGTFAFTNPGAVLGAGTHNVSVTFTPTDTANYLSSTGTLPITVAQATPTITTLPRVAAFSYGTALSSASLTGGVASVPGTFTFASPSIIPGAGNSTASVIFTPTDSVNYSGVSTTVPLTVTAISSSISSLPSAAEITYGNTLSASSLTGGVGSVPGTFAFTNPGAVLGAGTHNVSVTFTPTDTANYLSSTGTLPITVAQATPRITSLPSLGSLAFGASLSTGTLSGGAGSVPGSFRFGSPSTVPPSGTSTAAIIFTPSDTANYSTVTTSLIITVVELSPTPTSAPSTTPSPSPAPSPSPSPVNAAIVTLTNAAPLNPAVDQPVNTASQTMQAIVLAASAGAAAAGVAAAAGAGAAGAASSAGTAGSASSSGSSNSASSGDSHKDSSHAAEESSHLRHLAKAASVVNTAGTAGLAWGDQLPIWSLAAVTAFDQPTRTASSKVGTSTPLFSKFLNDGAYLRAMLGSAWIIFPLLALAVSVLGLVETGAALALPPVALVTAMAVLGAVDAFSGFVGFGVWAIVTLVHSGVSSASDIRFVMGVVCLGFTPLLLASGVRSIRRATTSGGHHWWNRLLDVVLAPIVAWWASEQILALLPSLAGVDIDVNAYREVIPAAVAFTMIARVMFEEMAAQWFPQRLAQTHEPPAAALKMPQRWLGIFIRAAIFYFIAGALIGDCWQLAAGTVLFVLPNILGLYASRFPNSVALHRVMPTGVVNLALGIFVGGVTLAVLMTVLGPVEDLAKMAFVILPLPTLVIAVLKLFGRSPQPGTQVWYENPRFAWPVRLGTLLVVVTFAYLIHFI
jgi:hypothetical protein